MNAWRCKSNSKHCYIFLSSMSIQEQVLIWESKPQLQQNALILESLWTTAWIWMLQSVSCDLQRPWFQDANSVLAGSTYYVLSHHFWSLFSLTNLYQRGQLRQSKIGQPSVLLRCVFNYTSQDIKHHTNYLLSIFASSPIQASRPESTQSPWNIAKV